ncbi:hypothetical protein MASR1M101_41990 [Gemmatimonas sp.]
MAPAYPEPLSLGLVPQDHDTQLLQDAPVLRRFPIREAPGFAVEVSDTPESVYLLGRPDGTEVPVPCRVCGTWNPAVLSGRHFFLSFEPDVALELSSVRRVTYHIGRLTFPSGWSASPWLAASVAASSAATTPRVHRRVPERTPLEAVRALAGNWAGGAVVSREVGNRIERATHSVLGLILRTSEAHKGMSTRPPAVLEEGDTGGVDAISTPDRSRRIHVFEGGRVHGDPLKGSPMIGPTCRFALCGLDPVGAFQQLRSHGVLHRP